MPEKKHKLNIFEVLGKINSQNHQYYPSLSEEEQKAIAPLVLMRWLTGTTDARQIYFLNELVNPFVFSLAQHKQLLFDLMVVCSSGKSRRYVWKKAKGKNSSKHPNATKVIQDYFGYSSSKAQESLPLLSTETILNYAEELGTQPDVIKLIKKELK